MTIHDILQHFRDISPDERTKGALFEKLIKRWLEADNRYNDLEQVWLWEEFPARHSDFGGHDIGVDLVARTRSGEYWAIQCKFYDKDTTIEKAHVDTFLGTSGKRFTDPKSGMRTTFSRRLWVATTNRWSSKAEIALQDQTVPVSRVSLSDLETSSVSWDELLNGNPQSHRAPKALFDYQKEAIDRAVEHYRTHDRGQLIMACGTGKTYTSLKMTDALLDNHGLVLFLVPSIALLGQTLNEWHANSERDHIHAVCVCSDSKASRKTSKEEDSLSEDLVDLALPACTDETKVARQLRGLRHEAKDSLVVVFSTYQSIEAVMAAQKRLISETAGKFGVFDLIICDEAHRTTGVQKVDDEAGNFQKVHYEKNIRGRRRLYMTATPRLYGENAKTTAAMKDMVLASMDDPDVYGPEFFRYSFSKAVHDGKLTDYKVLVLTVSEKELPEDIRKRAEDRSEESVNYDLACRMLGIVNGLSKNILGDKGLTWEADPCFMHRAMMFCERIGAANVPASSKNIEDKFPQLAQTYRNSRPAENQEHLVKIEAKHVDGSMGSMERNRVLDWLRTPAEDESTCKVVSNVKCLSEGVDVPSLDAVIFMAAKNSHVEVVQSVGRVMRNFRKGQTGEKRYGYIIIPVVVPEDKDASEALDDNKTYSAVWTILNALRSHDDRFEAIINSIKLNKKKPLGGGGVTFGPAGGGRDPRNPGEETVNLPDPIQGILIGLEQLPSGFYAKLVEKCGSREYWETWAQKVGLIAHKFIERITRQVSEAGEHRAEFEAFVQGLQHNINPSIDEAQAIEMLAQHLITRPVFDALFEDYRFVENNAVSRSMESMIQLLEEKGAEKDTRELDSFYESVRQHVGNIDNLAGKQTVIKNLYERFFKGAFPLTVEKLGIVYTPVECVDFIIHSVEDILRREFNTSLTEENVHILDPFTGTGTFVTRLLQSGLIRPEDMERKYLHEIHCNELVLLAYYIADVNIESVFHSLVKRDEYLPYDGICLTDTFQLNEHGDNDIFSQLFPENSERVLRQKKAPVRVIIGNPPYSIGQKSVNDNAQNIKYQTLEQRISDTYAQAGTATTKRALSDSYIKAFRWASDRIASCPEGGIVAFISNSGWLDGMAMDGMRACLTKEFTDIYVLDLRGNQRTSGELSRREGGKIFGSGSRTPIAITILVKNPSKRSKGQIHYHDIGDYLSREEKLALVSQFASVEGIEWTFITPSAKNDWLNQRDVMFDSLIPIGDKETKGRDSASFFDTLSLGVGTNRDAWCYNSSRVTLSSNIQSSISFYNDQLKKYKKTGGGAKPKDFVDYDPLCFSWTEGALADIQRGRIYQHDAASERVALYRPFFKQNLYFSRSLNSRVYQLPKLFPTQEFENRCICVHGAGGSKPFSCLIVDCIPDLNMLNAGAQSFPMYWYEERDNEGWLFNQDDDKYERHDGVSDWILKQARSRYGKSVTKEHIFYYVYGVLHSPEYRERFAADLKKSLPRIPLVEKPTDFVAFYKAGKALADLHLNYESVPAHPDVVVRGAKSGDFAVEKMRFPSKADKSCIIYNSSITLTNIPTEAYEYVVNGKSAIEWIMERYQVTVDKKSLIKNDPNDWAREHNAPRYILDLLLSVIHVSTQTEAIVKALPKLNF